MTFILFSLVLAIEFLFLLAIGISVFAPNSRIWPPPKKNSWQQWFSWFLFAACMFGVPLLGGLDFQSLGFSHWFLFLAGGFLFALGLAIDLWGTKTLSAQQSIGGKGKIITSGPYRYTRNPQYVGFILMYIGIIIFTSSLMALVTGTFLIFLFLVIPFSEEPWLRKQYGQSFEEYCIMVPRFIGFRSIKPVIREKFPT